MQFCRTFEDLYGPDHCRPNMHLHLHLKQCVKDFGPLHSFWCYAFERYNGTLGSFHTNRKSVEIQLMRKFCTIQDLSAIQLPEDSEFVGLLPKSNTQCCSSVSSVCIDDTQVIDYLETRKNIRNIKSFAVDQKFLIKPLPPFEEKTLSATLTQQLLSIYKQLYPDCNITHMPRFYKERWLTINGW